MINWQLSKQGIRWPVSFDRIAGSVVDPIEPFMRTFMQHFKSCLLWQLKLCQLVMFLTVFFYWMYKIKSSCYQDSSVFHGWFVYCAFVWEMHRLSKSLEIRVWMASFSKMSLLTCPCSRRKRVESLKRFRPHLMAFRSSISTGKLELLLSLMCFFFFFWFPKVERSLKAFRPFSTTDTKKMFRRILNYDFGCKKKAVSDFLASSSSWKIANNGKPA